MDGQTVQPGAESASTPLAPVDSTTFLESLSDTERAEFFSGSSAKRAERMSKPEAETPKATDKPAADAESAPAKPAEQAASTDATSKGASETPEPAKKKGLEARSQEVDLQIADLKRKLEIRQELERQLSTQTPPKSDAPRDSSTPANAKRVFEQYLNDPNAPKQDKYDSYDAWAIDMMDYLTDRKLDAREQASKQQTEQQQRARELETRVQASQQRLKTFLETNPDAKDRIHPTLLNLTPISALKDGDPIGPHNFIAEQIWRSDYPGQLAVHFSEHPEDFDALMRAGDPETIVRRIGRIEATFDKPAPDPSETRDTKPSPKTVPDAEEMPVVLGKKVPATASGTEAAIKSRDFAAYEREWKREHGLKD